VKNLSVHIGLAVIGLVSAYVVWTSEAPSEADGDGVVVVDCTPEQLTRVTFTAERRNAVLEPRGEGDTRAFWITVERTPEEGEATEVEFVTNEGIDEYLASIAPLKAVRSLGDVDPDIFEELELDEAHRATLEVVCGDQETTFYVGGSTFGTGDRYLVGAQGGPVYLLTGEIVRGLENAEFQLMQRELHAFEMTEVSGLTVEASGQRKSLTQRDYQNPQAAAWVNAESPDRINELYGNWLDRLSRLRVQAYLPLDAEPGADLEGASATVEPVFTLAWHGEDEDVGRLEMVKLPLETPVYYARSEATRAWVRVIATTAQQVEDDTRAVVGLPPIDRPTPPGAITEPPESPDGLAPPGSEGAPPEGGDPHSPTSPMAPDPHGHEHGE
jgi:hypothetical protein